MKWDEMFTSEDIQNWLEEAPVSFILTLSNFLRQEVNAIHAIADLLDDDERVKNTPLSRLGMLSFGRSATVGDVKSVIQDHTANLYKTLEVMRSYIELHRKSRHDPES